MQPEVAVTSRLAPNAEAPVHRLPRRHHARLGGSTVAAASDGDGAHFKTGADRGMDGYVMPGGGNACYWFPNPRRQGCHSASSRPVAWGGGTDGPGYLRVAIAPRESGGGGCTCGYHLVEIKDDPGLNRHRHDSCNPARRAVLVATDLALLTCFIVCDVAIGCQGRV